MIETSTYKTYDDLPMFLNVKVVSKLLGISRSSGYELMNEKGFPTLRIGNRIVVPRDRFISWLESKMTA